jgi:hypothetical protein
MEAKAAVDDFRLKASRVASDSASMDAVRSLGGWVIGGLLSACAGAAPRASAPESAPSGGEAGSEAGERPEAAPAPSEGDAAASASEETGLPAACTPAADLCLPPRAFVQRLCRDAYTGAALHLFAKGSPFSRGYVRSREVRAVNTLGGFSSDNNLRFGEEVVLLTHTGQAGSGGFQVSGMGGYDVLRWDGTCATLAEGELALRPPGPAGHAPLSWRYIDTNIQNALLLDEGIVEARRQHKKHCHGVSLGRISPACAKAEAELADRIVGAVRAGIALPLPERLP